MAGLTRIAPQRHGRA